MTRARLALAVASAVLLACGPIGPLPGGRLGGEVVAAPVTDWSFTDAVDDVEIETDPDDPYSVTVWGVGAGDRFYIASGRGGESRWARNLVEDPRVRLRVEGRIYELQAVRTDDAAEKELVIERLGEKYESFERDPEQEARAWLFRLQAR